jgi:phosphoribosylformylglycinamidine cyclo-ligase
MARTAYAQAGVDVGAGELAVELMRSHLASAGQLAGEFGSLIDVPEGMARPVIVTSADGVGTKTEIARRLGRLDTIGRDLVAMCADDVVCHGARPTSFMDYIAVGRVDPQRVAAIVGGIGDGCAEIGCALVGGETAEHPGLIADDAFDLAGFCVGFAERDDLIDASGSRPGDAIVGLASAGLHSNGYSLIRRLVDDGRLALDYELLMPTRLYAPAVLSLVQAVRDEGLRVGGLAHVTGGGLARNLPRAVGADLGVMVNPSHWPQPEIFSRVAVLAGIDGTEMRATFNCGIGFAAVLEPAAVDLAIATLSSSGIDAWVIGEVRSSGELGGRRFIEA